MIRNLISQKRAQNEMYNRSGFRVFFLIWDLLFSSGFFFAMLIFFLSLNFLRFYD